MPSMIALALSLSQEDFKVGFFFFFLLVAMATRVLHGIQNFDVSESASSEDHFCEVSLVSEEKFFLSNCLPMDRYWTVLDHNSSH